MDDSSAPLSPFPVPDAAPIPEAAHELLASALTDLKHRYSRRDLKVAARILKEATDRICQDVFFVPLDSLEDLGSDGNPSGLGE